MCTVATAATIEPRNAADPLRGEVHTARRRGMGVRADARVIHISAAVSYRERGSGVATFRRFKVPRWFQFGRNLVSLIRAVKTCNVARLRQASFYWC